MSDFRSTFDLSFSIQRAISTALAEATDLPVSVSEVIQQFGADAPIASASELVTAIREAAGEAGVPVSDR